jgi:hypothetical protein
MKIQCKICGSEFDRFIHWTHLRDHGLTSIEYKNLHGPISIPGKFTLPEERRQKISNGIKKYADDNAIAMQSRTAKAIATKIKNGYDFGSAMRGKKQSESSKNKSRETIKQLNQKRKIQSDIVITKALNDSKLVLHSNIIDTVVKLECSVCNTNFTFTKQYLQPSKFKLELCPTCHPRKKPISGKENEVYTFVKTLCPSAVQSYRSKYHSKEIDMFIPELNIGIEFNGLYWHSEDVLESNNRNKHSDFEKMEWAEKQSIRLIQIFEDEWDLHQDIVKSRLSSILHSAMPRVFARKCKVIKISGNEAAIFCNANHIMGAGRSNTCYGLFHDDTLISVMTFSKSNISRKVAGWELNRFCSLINTNVIGGASRLFTAFIRDEKPESVISYSDNRWSNGGVYAQLGFDKINSGTPNYWYVKPNHPSRIHRFTLRKPVTCPTGITERELRSSEGYYRIWDCGSSKWVWNIKS